MMRDGRSRWCLSILLLAGTPWLMGRNFAELSAKRSQYCYWQLDLRGERNAPEACRPWQLHAAGMNGGKKPRLISATFWSPSTGKQERKAKSGRSGVKTQYDYEPGENEPVRLEVVWRTEFGDRKTVTELARLPLPMGFRVRAGTESVVLSWDGIGSCPERWLEGPEFVVLRLDSSQLRFDYASINKEKRRCLLPTVDPKEVFSCPSSVVNWVDHDVVPGKSYVYGLLVRGTMKVVTTYGDTEPVVTPVPIEIAAPPHRWDQEDLFVTDWRCTRVATPGPARPVRLAVFHAEEYAPALEVEVRRLIKGLAGHGDLAIVERGIASTLLEEQDLQAMGGAGVQPVAAADLLVEYRLRTTANRVFRDTWLHDFLNADSRRIASFPAGETVGTVEVAEIATAVRAACPNRGPREKPKPKVGGGGTRSLAVVPPERLAGSRGADATVLTDLLVAGFDEAGLQMVDRERSNEAFRELEIDALATRAVELGKTVGADFFVAGNWGMIGTTEARGSFRLVRAKDGLRVSSGDFSAADPAELAALVVARFAPLVSGAVASHPAGVMHRLLEARALYRARDERRLRERAGHMWRWERVKDGQTAALTTPDDGASIAETARHYLRQGKTNRALDFLRNRLAKVGKTGSFWEAAEPLAGILRARGETTSEILLWQRLLARSRPSDVNYGCMALLLAEALVQQGRVGEATPWLAKVIPPPKRLASKDFRMYRKGRLLEKLRSYPEAARAYTEDWRLHEGRHLPSTSFQREWRPSISALARFLAEHDGGPTRTAILQDVVRWGRFPRQAARAARELATGDCTDRDALWHSFLALAAVGDDEPAQAVMQRLLTKGTGEIRRARGSSASARTLTTKARAKCLVAALAGPAKVQRHLTELKAEELVAGAFRKARLVSAGPQRMKTRPMGRDFLRPHIVTDALKRLAKGETVFALGRDRLWALQADGSPFGTAVWQHEWPRGFGLRAGLGNPALEIYGENDVHDGVVVVAAAGNGEVRAFDAKNGKLLWQYVAWTPVLRPVICKQQAYVITGVADMLVFDLASGKLLQKVTHPVEVEVLRPAGHAPRPSEDGRTLLVKGRPTTRYTLGQKVVVTIEGEFPARVSRKPSLLDAFCGDPKPPAAETPKLAPVARKEPSELAKLMAILADRGKPRRARSGALRKLRNELKRVPGSSCEQLLRQIAIDPDEETSMRRSAFRVLVSLPDNPGACLAMSLLDDDRNFIQPCLDVVARESDATWVEAVRRVRALPVTRWATWKRIDEQVVKVNLERTARNGFLAPEIGWDQAAVDAVIGEHLASQKAFSPESLTQSYEVAARTNSRHLPRLRDIVIGQVSGKRVSPIEVRAGEPWLGTAIEGVKMVRCMDKVHPAPEQIPILQAVLRPSKDMQDFTLRTTQVLGVQQLLRIGTPEAVSLVLARDEPLGSTDKDMHRGMDLLERACGRSFGTLTEWRLWRQRVIASQKPK